ncbi:hypothetical protein GCM10023081_15340 [Arthrobacter ginkgonis]|uniref:Bacterial Ig-like domain-containing protein n=1 Tax=Arthrobacter ginkgonis TaxID=1630594 RepID=A0ABP7C6C8_9MICC
MQPTAARGAGRRLPLVLALILALAAAFTVAPAAPSQAGSKKADDRIQATLLSYLDEPAWAYVGNPVEVINWFTTDIPADAPSGPTGTFTLTLHERGAKPYVLNLTGDEAEIRPYITPVKVGKRYYTVTYSGDKFYKPIKQTISYDVWSGPDTKTTLKVNKRTTTVSEPITLRAQVTTSTGRPLTGYSDGHIQFFADGEWIGEGISRPGSRGWDASLTIGYLPIGTHKITAAFEPFIHYESSASRPFLLTVRPPVWAAAATGSFTIDQSENGFSSTVSATVRATEPGGRTPTGYVQFYDGDDKSGLPVRLVNGVAEQTIWASNPRVSVKYIGDTRYAPAILKQAIPAS